MNWISVKERLPTGHSSPSVLACVWTRSTKRVVRARYFKNRGWRECPNNSYLPGVKCWMPMPTPPEVMP